MISTKIKDFLAGSVSIALAVSLTSCSSSADDSQKIAAYEDCKAYSQELSKLGADAFAEAMKLPPMEAIPYFAESTEFYNAFAENEAKCEAL